MEITNAIVLFTDIRGFTKWSKGIEAFQYIDIFINKFCDILKEQFPPEIYLKKLGDGAMVVKVIETDVTIESVVDMLTKNLDKLRQVEAKFKDLCNDFFKSYGYRTERHLGWGLVRGVVKKLNGDFIGANINKCARLCGIARPFGIVIEKDDFPTLPRDTTYNFRPQTRKLGGIVGDVKVWVTDEIATLFTPREKMREAPEIHVAGLCIKIAKGNIMALIARRETNRKLYPGLYEGCGGQLAYSEALIDGVKRHFRLEMDIDVDVIERIHNFYEIKEPNEPLIPGIKFLCLYSAGTQESKNHSEIRWVSEEELKLIPPEEFIPGLKDDFINFIEMYKNRT
ncbi:hypothetical protein C5S53_12570 [Methanophagales archaeon]|nr:hypothetical protein C5S53_12570 [Methanophagales archaeon]